MAEGRNVSSDERTEIDDPVPVFQADVRPVLFEQARQPLQHPVPLQIAQTMPQRMGGLRQGGEQINSLTSPEVQRYTLADAHDAAGSCKLLR